MLLQPQTNSFYHGIYLAGGTQIALKKTYAQFCLIVTLLTYCGQNRVQFNYMNVKKTSNKKIEETKIRLKISQTKSKEHG